MSCLRNLAPQIVALLLGASASVGSFAQATLKFGEGAGEVMVREQAEKKGKQLKQHAGKVLFFDPSPPTKVGEEVIFNFHWQVGFGKTMVVMTARVPYAAREAPDVKRFMASDMDAIIASLRRVGG